MERRFRTLELALVLRITVLPDIFQSTVEAVKSYKPFQPVAAYLVYGVVRCLSAIALVVYVLARSDRTIRDIGVNFEPRDCSEPSAYGVLELRRTTFPITESPWPSNDNPSPSQRTLGWLFDSSTLHTSKAVWWWWESRRIVYSLTLFPIGPCVYLSALLP